MKHIYAVTNSAELQRYQTFVSTTQSVLDQYITYLQTEFQVTDLPRAILWTNGNIATRLISDIPIPAYTNDYRIVMCPDVEAWKNIYKKQIDGLSGLAADEIRHYYENGLNQHHILQILGHELAHHSNLFIDEVYDSGEGIWFEEGMAEYISRCYFLTDAEYQQEKQINQQLMTLRENDTNCLDNFGISTYQKEYAEIFHAYWQSFLAVDQIVEKFGGDIRRVFDSYRQWYESRSTKKLAQWFGLEP